MRLHPLKSAMAMAVVAGMAILGGASPAKAIPVTYTTVGTFTGGTTSGTSVYTNAAGIRIAFVGVESDTVDAPSQASFGQFDTNGTTAPNLASIPAGVTFRLDIFQTAPVQGGPATFVGSLNGSLSNIASQAFVQFTGSLSQTITGGGTTTTYTIVEADRDPAGTPVQGRANINPPSTQAGLSSVEGFITTTANPVPEPSTLLMGALAAPAVLVCLRRKGKITV
jgi:hypothetical protein